MPEISEVLGAIVAGITQARRIADEEAVKVARYYQQQPLLKGLSVPRVRLPEVVIELPVIVQSYEPAQPAQLPSPDAIRGSAQKFAIEQLNSLKKLPVEFGDKFESRLYEEFKGIDEQTNPDTNVYADATRRAILSVNQSTDASIGSKYIDLTIEKLHEFLTQTVVLRPATPAKMQVQVETEQIKNQSTPQSVTRLRLSLREEGLEWHEISTESGTTQRLSPE